MPPFAKRFFALHICEGVANYPELKKMILVREEALRRMDPTFQGRVVKFGGEHLEVGDSKKMDRAENKGAEGEGTVVKSFFNEADGRHWAEIMVWDKEALSAIEKGIGVSNAYLMKPMAPGGDYHAVKYDEEVMDGIYDHLLITDSPRYEESKILTPEEFKKYNEERQAKLALVTNKLKETEMEFKLFGRKPIEGLPDLKGIEVELPLSKKTVLITNVLNAVDKQMENEEKGEAYADNSHKVKLNENEVCTVADLVTKHKNMTNEMERMRNELEEWEKAGNGEQHAENEMTPEEKKKKEEDEKTAKNAKEEADKKELENKVAKNKKIAEKVARLKGAPVASFIANNKGAGASAGAPTQPTIRFKEDAVRDGLKNYGSASLEE